MFTPDTIRRMLVFLIGLLTSWLAAKGIIVPEEVVNIFIAAVTALVSFYLIGSNIKAAAEKKAEAAKVQADATVEVAKINAASIDSREKAVAELQKSPPVSP